MLVFLAFSSLVALLMTRLGVRAKQTSDVLKASIDEDGDGVVSSQEMRHYLARHTTRCRLSARRRASTMGFLPRVSPPARSSASSTHELGGHSRAGVATVVATASGSDSVVPLETHLASGKTES